jgi:hypothetical protein
LSPNLSITPTISHPGVNGWWMTVHEDTHTIQDLNILVSGDFYFHNFLSSIVKLTDLGLYILESIKGIEKQWDNNVVEEEQKQHQQQQISDFSTYADLSR